MPDRLLQFFTAAHLPPPLQAVSTPFCVLANLLVATVPQNPERTVALRKLLEAKDCAVRAMLYQEPPASGGVPHASSGATHEAARPTTTA